MQAISQAAELNIQIVTAERELLYFKEIAKRIGHSARYQFHAEFLKGSKVKALEHKVFALRTSFGKNRAYTFFASPTEILPVAFVNHRDLRDPNAAPAYQRLIHRPRLRDIATFLQGGGYFPNSVILNFKKKIRFDLLKPEDDNGISPGILTLPNTYKSAWVIDGQHRLYSYAELDEHDHVANLPFLAFEEISIAQETQIFADINSKQKSVPKRLLDEISGETQLNSPDKRKQIRAIASRAFDLMRDDDDGPLGGKISGVEVKFEEQSILTIPSLVDATLQSGLLGKINPQGDQIVFMQGPIRWDAPEEAIAAICHLVGGFLDLFRKANPDRWEAGRDGKFVVNRGVAGLIRLLGDLIQYMGQKEQLEPRELNPIELCEQIEKYVEPCTKYFKDAPAGDVNFRFDIPFGSGGPRVFQHRLRELVKNKFADFDPSGFDADLRKYDEARRNEADLKIRRIQDFVHGFIVRELRQKYPASGDEYLEKAVDNQDILTAAYKKRLDADAATRQDIATYLDFVDLRKIVESAKNWEHFKPYFHIQLPDDPKGRAKYVRWFDEMNKMRRIVAHPYNRGYDDNQIQCLNAIYGALCERGVIVGGA